MTIYINNQFHYETENLVRLFFPNDKIAVVFFGGGSLGSSFAYSYFKQLLKQQLDINIIYNCVYRKYRKQHQDKRKY